MQAPTGVPGEFKDHARLMSDLMVLAFTLLNALLEAFLFARGNPVWMTTWLAVAGLHILPKRDGTT